MAAMGTKYPGHEGAGAVVAADKNVTEKANLGNSYTGLVNFV